MQSNYYYNLATKSEVQSDDILHISAQLKQVDFGGQSYGMPCVVLGNVYAQLSDSTRMKQYHQFRPLLGIKTIVLLNTEEQMKLLVII